MHKSAIGVLFIWGSHFIMIIGSLKCRSFSGRKKWERLLKVTRTSCAKVQRHEKAVGFGD